MNAIQALKIGPKIYAVMALLVVVATAVGVMGVQAMRTYDAKVAEITRASKRAVVGERVNGLILSVVMDSRGIYMARDKAEAEKFAKPLLASLRKLEVRMAEWRGLLDGQSDQFERADANAKQFVAFRTELARLGVTVGNPTAREYGDNDANRANRQALNVEIQGLADANNKLIERLEAELGDFFTARLRLMVSLTVVGIVAALGLAIFVVVGFITRPMAALTAVIEKLAGGDKSVDIPGVGRGDEIGTIAEAVEVFKRNLIETERLEAEQRAAEQRAIEEQKQREEDKRKAEAEQRAAEDRAKEQRRRDMLALADTFESQVGKVVTDVSGAASQLQSTAGAMSATAEQTRNQSANVAAAAEQASANVQTVATAAEELSSSIGEIARQVVESNRIAREAVEATKATNEKVQSLSNAAQKIGEVVNLINDIASQTNLLALNATIEAARAGEAGKGFAVVASEVKSLATQTAKATEDIAGQIGAIQASTGNAVQAIQAIGATISEVAEIATTIASAVEEQGAATREIASNVQQAASGAREVTSNIAGVSEAARETGQATDQVLTAANVLVDHGETLKREVDRFLKTVRAA